MEFGRIIALSDGEKHSFVKRRWLTKFFVTGDVVSFLAQAGGTVFPRSFNIFVHGLKTLNKC
jgi:hypothetical protein